MRKRGHVLSRFGALNIPGDTFDILNTTVLRHESKSLRGLPASASLNRKFSIKPTKNLPSLGTISWRDIRQD